MHLHVSPYASPFTLINSPVSVPPDREDMGDGLLSISIIDLSVTKAVSQAFTVQYATGQETHLAARCSLLFTKQPAEKRNKTNREEKHEEKELRFKSLLKDKTASLSICSLVKN